MSLSDSCAAKATIVAAQRGGNLALNTPDYFFGALESLYTAG